MNFHKTDIEGLVVFEPKVFEDSRGFFFESFRQETLPNCHFVQDNISRSTKGVLRGLHFQNPQSQGKLVRTIKGIIWDIAVDLRPNSSTFGKHFGIELSEFNKLSMYIPEGFAHGFCVLSDIADFSYKCTAYYVPQYDSGILWNDVDLNIKWPIQTPIISDKDQKLQSFKDFCASLVKE